MGGGGMFDRIAFAYDSTNKYMTFGLDSFWRRTLVNDCMVLRQGDRVLDLATGTADVALLAGARLHELQGARATAGGATAGGAPVLGVDPSIQMLQRGVGKAEAAGLGSVVRLSKGDAQNLSSVRLLDATGALSGQGSEVASGSLDKISMAFGIRNVPDRSRALREMHRVMRKSPSSRVCILEFSLPSGETLLSRIALGFITHVIPMIGKVATFGSGADEYRYLERSIVNFPKPRDFAGVMAEAGLPVTSITSFAFGAVHLYTASVSQGSSRSTA